MSLKEKSQIFICWECKKETPVDDAKKSHDELGNITVKEYKRMFGSDNDGKSIMDIDGYETVVLCEHCLPKHVESVMRKNIEEKRIAYIKTLEPRIRDYFSPFDLNKSIDGIFRNDGKLIEYFEFSFPIIMDILELNNVIDMTYVTFYVTDIDGENTIHYNLYFPFIERYAKRITNDIIYGLQKYMKSIREKPPIDINFEILAYPHTLLEAMKRALNGNDINLDANTFDIVDCWISEVDIDEKECANKFFEIFKEVFSPKNIDGYNDYNIEFNVHDSIIHNGDRLFSIFNRSNIERMLDRMKYVLYENMEYVSWSDEMIKFIEKYEDKLKYVYPGKKN